MAEVQEVSLDVATAADATLLSNLVELYAYDLGEAFPVLRRYRRAGVGRRAALNAHGAWEKPASSQSPTGVVSWWPPASVATLTFVAIGRRVY
jgi:hypothetical protein